MPPFEWRRILKVSIAGIKEYVVTVSNGIPIEEWTSKNIARSEKRNVQDNYTIQFFIHGGRGR